jgi:hypothetical protein
MGKIAREQADLEVTNWLDKKKIFDETRDKYKEYIELIIDAIVNGVLVLDPNTFEFTHDLSFPLGEEGNASIAQLKYKLRINDKMIQPNMRGVKADDADGRLNAIISTLIGQSKAVVSNLDSQDKRISTAIAVFFM